MTSAALVLIIYGAPAPWRTGTPAPRRQCTICSDAPVNIHDIWKNAGMINSLNSYHELLRGIFMRNISPVYFLNKGINNRCVLRKLSPEYFMPTTACRRVGHADVEPCRCLKFYMDLAPVFMSPSC